jgi:hypothetical protein
VDGIPPAPPADALEALLLLLLLLLELAGPLPPEPGPGPTDSPPVAPLDALDGPPPEEDPTPELAPAPDGSNRSKSCVHATKAEVATMAKAKRLRMLAAYRIGNGRART